MILDDAVLRVHSASFIETWRTVIADVMRWRVSGPFVAVRGFRGSTTLSYLPHLNFTDLLVDEGRSLAAEAGQRRHLVRCLDPARGPLAAGDQVAMRVSIRGCSTDDIWTGRMTSGCRNRVRKAVEGPTDAIELAGQDGIAAFEPLLARTLHRHGAPRLPPQLLVALADALPTRIVMVRGSGQDVAGVLAFVDGPLMWCPWVATEPRGRDVGAGERAMWTLLQSAAADGLEAVDLGRSPFGGGTYQFKRKWGAVPVPLTWITNQDKDIYRAYGRAQQLWRRLPDRVADAAGPVVTRRLADY